MNSKDESLAHSIKMKFRTAPAEPNEAQLTKIKADLQKIVNLGRVPTESDWQEIVYRHCPGTGKYGYKGVDNSDLTTLLQLATNTSGK